MNRPLKLIDIALQAEKQMIPGARVVRSSDWKWKQQDGSGVGTVNSSISSG